MIHICAFILDKITSHFYFFLNITIKKIIKFLDLKTKTSIMINEKKYTHHIISLTK